MVKALGIFTHFMSLSEVEREVVQLAWKGAESSHDHQLCFKSDFPVGSGILACNKEGAFKQFCGCNVENNSFPATICAERNAATTATMEGYNDFRIVAVLCRKYPGGSPCGVCRQVLVQFGQDAILLNVVDLQSNVRKAMVRELLPAACGKATSFDSLRDSEQALVNRAVRLKSRSYVPYSKRPRAALFIATNKNGHERIFNGVSDDNASYGASALAEAVAMRSARTAGYTSKVRLVATVDDISAANPLDGESLQILREFGADLPIMLVGEDKSVVTTSLDDLFPDSFGPDSI